VSARGRSIALALCAALARCAPSPAPADSALRDPAISRSRFNTYTCATCHALDGASAEDRIFAGAPLPGALSRPTFWGGAVRDVRAATDECFRKFMRGAPLDREPEAAARLLAALRALPELGPRSREAQPFTVVYETSPPAAGDAARGAIVYDSACRACHGAAHTGEGQTGAGVLPEDTEARHRAEDGYTIETLRHTIVHKARMGSYNGFAGTMPPFSREALSDADLADIVTFLGPQLR
jgi:thiosulfate dehydrogenase